jgi:hypothetical protein
VGAVIAAIAGIIIAGASTVGLVTVTNNASMQSSSTSTTSDGSGSVPNNANVVVYGSNN